MSQSDRAQGSSCFQEFVQQPSPFHQLSSLKERWSAEMTALGYLLQRNNSLTNYPIQNLLRRGSLVKTNNEIRAQGQYKGLLGQIHAQWSSDPLLQDPNQSRSSFREGLNHFYQDCSE